MWPSTGSTIRNASFFSFMPPKSKNRQLPSMPPTTILAALGSTPKAVTARSLAGIDTSWLKGSESFPCPSSSSSSSIGTALSSGTAGSGAFGNSASTADFPALELEAAGREGPICTRPLLSKATPRLDPPFCGRFICSCTSGFGFCDMTFLPKLIGKKLLMALGPKASSPSTDMFSSESDLSAPGGRGPRARRGLAAWSCCASSSSSASSCFCRWGARAPYCAVERRFFISSSSESIIACCERL
mmetsp:Transcript_19012/g.44354  ORF Transcript_19012/g.44354 Transcript_19012/m.44354 type:complete len:244 (-) Transcript_19012:78-809(-)